MCAYFRDSNTDKKASYAETPGHFTLNMVAGQRLKFFLYLLSLPLTKN